jgi:hypothetical protein
MSEFQECPLRNGNHVNRNERKKIELAELQEFFRQHGFTFTFPEQNRSDEECDGIPERIKCKHYCSYLIQEFGEPGVTTIYPSRKNQLAIATT